MSFPSVYTTFKKKKQLVLQKISLEAQDNEKYKEHLDKIFSDPNQYFSNTFNGNEVVIGKRFSNKILNIPHYQSNRKSIYYLRNMRTQQSHNSSRSVIKFNEGKSNITGKGTQLPPNKRYIDDQELKEIYDKFKEIKTENTQEQTKNSELLDQKMLSEFNKTGQKEMTQIFSYQEKVLKKHDSTNKSIQKISRNLSKKLKRPLDNLLMSKTENFRIKKELKDIFSKEVQERSAQPSYKWVINLRDNSDHYINFGSIQNPKWQLMISPRAMNETIRNPNTFLNFNHTDYNFYRKDHYLKKKVSYNTYSTFAKDMSKTANGFSKMSIKGEDLLQFEIDNSKALKGKKILTTPKTGGIVQFNVERNNTEETYGQDIDAKELMRRKGRTSSNFY